MKKEDIKEKISILGNGVAGGLLLGGIYVATGFVYISSKFIGDKDKRYIFMNKGINNIGNAFQTVFEFTNKGTLKNNDEYVKKIKR